MRSSSRTSWKARFAFMFETRFPQRVTAYAAGAAEMQKDYGGYGQRLHKHFNPNQR